MYSAYQRINNIFALLSTCIFALLGAIALSSFVFTADPKGSLSIGSLKVYPGRSPHFKQLRKEYAFVNFEVHADLSPLFHWNTKQLFVYLGAEYTSADGTRNDVVIWDRIIRRKEDANLNVKGRNKYEFRDVAVSFKNVTPAHYTLKYNTMPYVGVLTYSEAARTDNAIPFPLAQERV
ncbi:signal peptidase [Schizopora paradoxa]|uniref:Signal peptidase subunit 3 n=1 Tax=Schizopora paradoxa TaxID=27342 RepID=A0A0H2RBB8_9AGAM|nr:signal peptidase [Schizopora paradoxa]